MKVTIDPGKPGPHEATEAQELRVELEDGEGYSVLVLLTEYRGSVLVTVAHGDPSWKPGREPRSRRGGIVPGTPDVLIVDSYPVPAAPVEA